jgi:diphthamide synthase subunit DPH2
VLHRMFYNGLYLPKKFMKDEVAVIPYDWFCAIGKQYRHSRLLAVNPHTMEGAMRIMDRKRGKIIMKRAKKMFGQCRKMQPELTAQYRKCSAEFTSAEFWKTYLGI